MKKYLFLLLASAFSSQLLAQSGTDLSDNRGFTKDNVGVGAFESMLTRDNSDKNIRGTRYFVAEYSAGQLITKNGKRYTSELTYKFDEYLNNLQVKFADGKEALLFYHNIDSFSLFVGSDTVNYVKADVPNEREVNKFYQVIYSSANYQLIKLPRKVVTNVDTRNGFGDGEQFKQFDDKGIYFFKKGSAKPYEKVKISKKALLKLLPNKKPLLDALYNTPQYKGILDDVKLKAILKEIDK